MVPRLCTVDGLCESVSGRPDRAIYFRLADHTGVDMKFRSTLYCVSVPRTRQVARCSSDETATASTQEVVMPATQTLISNLGNLMTGLAMGELPGWHQWRPWVSALGEQ